MATPVIIDTDMGVDDAVAVALALCSPELELVGLVSVGGNVPLQQASANLGRMLGALGLERMPRLARGLDQDAALDNATHVHGPDGLGGLDLVSPAGLELEDYLAFYEALIEEHGDALSLVAIGPLTNLAAVVEQRPGLLSKVGSIIVMGGAVWCPGNVTPHAEFNFYRDPAAAKTVLEAGLPVTLVALDVTRQVTMDESHLAHLSASGSRTGELLARMIRFPMEQHVEDGHAGRFIVHDAVAVAVLIWPALFMRSRMGIQVATDGEKAGQTRPMVAKDKSRQIGVVISVKAGDLLENLLETLCQEEFIV